MIELVLGAEELEEIKLLIVDDHTLFAEGTVSLLSGEPRIRTVGVAINGSECLNLVSKIKVDVVLLDVELPDVCGFDLIDRINGVQLGVKIIMITGNKPEGYITKSIIKNADGFLLKNCTAGEMIRGILKVYRGEGYFSKSLKAFLPVIKNNNLDSLANPEITMELLTPKETEIIELVARGLHNKEVASVLNISVRTVEFHMSSILAKLGASKRFEAVLAWANCKKILASIGEE